MMVQTKATKNIDLIMVQTTKLYEIYISGEIEGLNATDNTL